MALINKTCAFLALCLSIPCVFAQAAATASAAQVVAEQAQPVASQPETARIYDVRTKSPLLPPHAYFCLISPQAISNLYYKVLPLDKESPPYYMQANVPRYSYSSTFFHNAPGPVEFYWIDSPTSAPEPAFRVELPSGREKSCIVLKLENPAESGKRPKVSFFDIDVSERAFPAESYMVLNLADHPVAGRIDGELFRPLPVYLKPKRKSGGSVDVDLYAYIEQKDGIDNVVRTQLRINENRRYWVCFFPSSNKARPKIVQVTFPEPMKYDADMVNKMQESYNKDLANEK